MSEKQIGEAAERPVSEHRLEVVSRFWADGYVCECSCGWRSEEMGEMDDALSQGRHHTLATHEGLTQATLLSPPESDFNSDSVAGTDTAWRGRDG